MKNRVMIANSLMLFISRYVINFIKFTSTIKQKLKKKYFRLMWNDKKIDVIKDLHACISKIDERISCLDIKSVVNVNIIKIIVKATIRSQLSWIKIVNDFVIRDANIFEAFTKSINKSWLQWFFKAMKLFLEFKYIWTRWKRIYSFKHTNKIIWLKFSKSHNDVMNTYVWYHFLIEITSKDEARRWSSHVWKLL